MSKSRARLHRAQRGTMFVGTYRYSPLSHTLHSSGVPSSRHSTNCPPLSELPLERIRSLCRYTSVVSNAIATQKAV